jgi:hypothetical protein
MKVNFMDSIEKMRKINNLTKELKQHGFAEDSFQAIQQVNQIYGNDEVTHEVRHGLTVTPESENNAPVSSVEKKITLITENIDILSTKINEMVRAINDLDSRYTILKSWQEKQQKQNAGTEYLQNNKQGQETPNSVEPTSTKNSSSDNDAESGTAGNTQTSKQASPDQTGQKKNDEYSFNQRTGNYTATDVAIDKVFYFGKK